jgi:biotin carboxyl carrier protein
MTINHEVISPCQGMVEQVLREEFSYLNEGDPIFVIKTDEGPILVTADYSGKVKGIEVGLGDEVIPGMILSYIQEDIS